MQRNPQLMRSAGASICAPEQRFRTVLVPLQPHADPENKRLISGLFMNGSYVRIRTGEPLCFYEHHRTQEVTSFRGNGCARAAK
jgi:hypothetical protein